MSDSEAPLRTRGLHHVTAIASKPQANVDFYTGTLGLRLVKKTVNFDDPATYHLYYGDEDASPGTILTFFPWPGAARGTQGSGQAITTAFSVPAGSLGFWADRLRARKVDLAEPATRFGQPLITFADHDGMILELIEAPDVRPSAPPRRTAARAGVPPEYAILAFHGVTFAIEGYESTARVLAALGYTQVTSEDNRFRYRAARPGHSGQAPVEASRAHEVDTSGPGPYVDLLCMPDADVGRLGAGVVHHVAFRSNDEQHQLALRAKFVADGFNVTPVVDRSYFRSIYFREPGGVLIEVATDGPGFAVDEPIERLGERLCLPPRYEHLRGAIERRLPTITPTA